MIARLFAAVLLAVSGAAAQAATIETEIVKGEFVFEDSAVAPGSSTVVALDMTLAPGWHTYWKNAGDSGQPVEITWTLPEGVTVGEAEWPVPHRQPFATMMNYGYEDQSTLLMPVSVPADWEAGTPVEMKADVFWLVCAEVCIPEQGETTVSLPTAPETTPNAGAAALFAKARATLPVASPYPASYSVDDGGVTLRLKSGDFAEGKISDAYVFPAEWGVIDHAGEQVVTTDATGLMLRMARSPENDEAPSGPLEGVIEITETAGSGTATMALSFTAEQVEDVGGTAGVAAKGNGDGTYGSDKLTIWQALGFAFLGGLILNLMPCVFPVLALKALGFAEMRDSSLTARASHGLAYTAGVLVLFVALGAVFLALREAVAGIGWGFQLQNPYLVAGLAYLMFVIALNLSGVFEVSSRFAGVGSDAAASGGTRGAFFTGALTAVVATPCTAPFMGAAMGATLAMPANLAMYVFIALALGLAAPFLILSLSPAAARMLPRPGAWMVRFKEFLAFPMYMAAALLVWVLGSLVDRDAMLAMMVGGALIGMAAWAWGVAQQSDARGRRLGGGTALVSGILALSMFSFLTPSADAAGEPFSAARLAELRGEGAPVFVNMTADWCITCKFNEKVAMSADFEQALVANDVTYLKGDWTRYDEEITAVLEEFGRAGVPLYVIYPREGEPVLLPQMLTPSLLVEALDRV